MCDYTAKWFGASYIDGACHDGHMWDLDGDGLTMEYNPCPKCNTAEFLECVSEDTGCGVSMGIPWCQAINWENAVKLAKKENRAKAKQALKKMRRVECDDWPDREAVYKGRASWSETQITVYQY